MCPPAALVPGALGAAAAASAALARVAGRAGRHLERARAHQVEPVQLRQQEYADGDFAARREGLYGLGVER